LKNTDKTCFVCGSSAIVNHTGHYQRCGSCGHETLIDADIYEDIINDRLDRDDFDRLNSLDRFKKAVLSKCARSKAFLLDVGSASGRFLYQNRGDFEQSLGIEVTPECVNFARELGLHIETDLATLNSPLAVVAFWHSLEHIPVNAIEVMFTRIRECSTDDTVVVVSVPNAGSLQYSLLKERFAYYDVPHHLHQFTPVSLDKLMIKFGFTRYSEYGSFSYASFGWLQGLLNLFNRHHDYLYYRKKRGWVFGLSSSLRMLLDAYNLALASLLFIPSIVLALYDLLLLRRGGVLTVCYQREKDSK